MTRAPSLHNISGYTLIELVVYLGITSALMAAVISFSYQFLDSVASINTAVAIEENGNFILQRALYDFDDSLPVTIPAMALSLPINNISIGTSSISFSILTHDFSLTPFIKNN